MPDVKRLSVAGGVVVLLLLLFWRAASSVSQPSSPPARRASSKVVPSTNPSALSAAPSPRVSLGEPAAVSEVGTRGYAVALPELSGLPADALPGTRLELWVAWEPPVTKQPRIQRLATSVTLDRIVPPVTPDGSPAALLRIPRREIPSVLYGDRYGAMSVVVTGG